MMIAWEVFKVWFVAAAIVHLAIGIAIGPVYILRGILRYRDRRALARGTEIVHRSYFEKERHFIPLPYSFAFGLLLVALCVSNPNRRNPLLRDLEAYDSGLPPLLFIAGVIGIGLGLISRLSLRPHRAREYELFLCGLSALYPLYHSAYVFLLGFSVFCIINVTGTRLLSKGQIGVVPVYVAFRAIRDLGPVAFVAVCVVNVAAIVPLLHLYLAIRYLLAERMSLTPIVYLRSFSADATARIYSELVAPLFGRYGVVAGLIHETQTNSELQERTSDWSRG